MARLIYSLYPSMSLGETIVPDKRTPEQRERDLLVSAQWARLGFAALLRGNARQKAKLAAKVKQA